MSLRKFNNYISAMDTMKFIEIHISIDINFLKQEAPGSSLYSLPSMACGGKDSRQHSWKRLNKSKNSDSGQCEANKIWNLSNSEHSCMSPNSEN